MNAKNMITRVSQYNIYDGLFGGDFNSNKVAGATREFGQHIVNSISECGEIKIPGSFYIAELHRTLLFIHEDHADLVGQTALKTTGIDMAVDPPGSV